ncbi:MAG: peptidase M1 [Geobacteraceae bacterium GWC2_58_44]|nr:MAG: peptidase M1 [Geobacteraceae bacterium GWC2_58_44]HBG07912.1 peptidase M1 [Geobacter sp.]
MKSFSMWSLLALLVFCSAGACHAGTPGPAVQRQDIAVTLEPEGHTLMGQSTITFAAGTRQVALRLSAEASIDSVAVSGKKAPFSFDHGTLLLELLPTGTAESIPVTVSYRATFNDPVSRHPAASEDPSYGVNGAITREGTFLGGGAYWYPVPSQIPARRSISITAPAGTEAVTAGRRLSRETTGAVTRSVWEEARPVGVLSLCAGPYRVEERRVDGIDLYTYFYPDNAALASRYLDAAAKYLNFYSELFGAYPFEKFAVVENFFPTGYGFPSFTLLGGSVIRLPFIIDTSFPHEIAHSWWGNGIDVDPAEGNWSEGLVTYLADYLLKERRSPVEARDYRRQLLIDYASLVTPGAEFPLSAFLSRSDPASRAIGYGKGAMLFHMVRSQIGDRAFFEALRQLCRDHLYGSASWSDFVRAFSRSAGRDLGPFMNQWLVRSGGPGLSLAEVTSRREGKGWRVSGSIVQSAPLFELPVPLALETAGAQVKEVVPVRGERTRFTISSNDPPGRLLLDPGSEVFRILGRGEIPATVNSIKGSSRLIGVITPNCRAGRETFGKLLTSLSQGGATLVNEADLGRKAVEDYDLVFCGAPRDRSLLPQLPEGVELSDSGFSIDAERYGAPDGLLFLVLQFPGASPRVAAVFQPLSDAAAEQYSPKITHYGKYGYLVFSGGANRRKGTAPALDGAAVVGFPP